MSEDDRCRLTTRRGGRQITQSAKEINRKRASVCAAIALEMFLYPPRLSEKQLRLMICRDYLYLMWVIYYRKRKKPSGEL